MLTLLIKVFKPEFVGNKVKVQISKNRCYKKTNHVKFSDKQTFLTP